MPLYEFKCDACNHQMEIRLTSWRLPTTYCPKCGAVMTRVPSAPNFTVKGYSAKTGYTTKEDPKE
jgi:putative FmdB family regulatory protein